MKYAKKALIVLTAVLLSAPFMVAKVSAKHEKKQQENSSQRTPKEIDSVETLSQWMTYYYLDPKPELMVPALIYADKKDLLKGDPAAPMQAFASRVFAQNPDKIREWFNQLAPLSDSGKTLVMTSIWWSNTKQGKDLLDAICAQLAEKPKAEFKKQIDKNPPEVDKMDIESPDVLDMLWGSFSATGDEKYVKRLLTTLPWAKGEAKDMSKLLIASAARWSLISNIQQHEKVKKICESVESQDAELKPFLENVLAEASAQSKKAKDEGFEAKAEKEKSKKKDKQVSENQQSANSE